MNKVKTIIFFNIKGGVGKTTLTVNTASMLDNRLPGSHKILIIDLDAQASATNYIFGQNKQNEFEKIGKTAYNLLSEYIEAKEKEPSIEEFIIKAPDKWGKSLYIVPGSYDILEVEKKALVELGTWLLLLRNVVDGAFKQGFNYIFIDPPASFGTLSKIAIGASNYFIVPVIPDELGRGSFKLFIGPSFRQVIFELRKTGIPPDQLPVCGGVVFNRVRSNSNQKIIADKIREEIKKQKMYGKYPIPVYKTILNDYVAYTYSLEQHIPIFRLPKKYNNAKKQFEAYFNEFYDFVINNKAIEFVQQAQVSRGGIIGRFFE